jgi:ABC-2 type transport system ATP-binding protein
MTTLPTSQPPTIEVLGVAKSYGRTPALHPTTLSVPPGSIFALLGHNGAGKTTLLKLLMNILQPSSGSASVLGRPAAALAGDDFTRVGYVSENQELPGWMTVGAFLRYQRGFYPQWDDAALIQRFDLPLRRKLKHLSRGQRMKTALASVLAFRPTLIVLDEPFSGLDPLVRDELIEALLDGFAVQTAAGAQLPTILLSSHDLAEIESFATHVAFLHGGRLLFAEEMPALSARFREVTFTLPNAQTRVTARVLSAEEAAAEANAPSPLPASWLQFRWSGRAIRFVHSRADTEPIEQQIRELFPEATNIEAEPMNLRSIFLAIAKSGRTVASTEGSTK